ncbi:DinB family protein [Paenibacillus sp. GCM10027629]|uniref:DinB family protein n=1 Tax=Paenibacillus sp. GCM10027629 TaxID=3273414 RepID=UPI0036330EC6
MSKTQHAIEEIERLSDQLMNQATGLSEAVLNWKPSEEAWSVMEILCHVEEAVPYWLKELECTVKSPGTEWGRGLQDEARLAAVASAGQRELADVMHGIVQGKQMAKEVLGSVRDEDLAIEASSRNPRFGIKPMAFIVSHLLIEHLQKHLNQIQRNLQQYEQVNQSM